MSERDTFVYLIAVREEGSFLAPVKVGVSDDPEARLSALQTACPYEIGLVAKLAYPSRDIARGMEGCFHSTQARHRLRGEWFDIPPHKAVQLLRLQARFSLVALTDLDAESRKLAIGEVERFL